MDLFTQNAQSSQNKSFLRVQRILRALACCVVAGVAAQPAPRRATNLAALLAYPGFYHGRPVVIVGKVALEQDRLRVSDEAGNSVHLVFKGNAPDGLDEIRGEFWDVGRMKVDDPRLATYDVRAVFHFDPEGAWPRPGEVTAIVASAVSPASPPMSPSIRAIVLNPSRYADQKVTITGQYSGRNLLGDLPDAPARSRYDFVLRSSDAAIWVSNMRPRLRDTNGKEFDLALDSRLDTSRWLTVRGTIQQARGLQLLDAEAGSLALAKPPTETPAEDEPIRVPAAPPPEVVFSAPTQDETDVMLSTTVRIQFSRDLDQATLKGHIRARYLDSQTAERGEPTTPTADFTFQYNGAARVLELRFTKPLERFRTLKVDLLEGIMGTDGQPLKPWTLTFALGGA
jgi:Big-like domain-containing protein